MSLKQLVTIIKLAFIMPKKGKIIIVLVAVLLVGFFSARYYAYHGSKRDIQTEKAAFTVSSKNIVAEFTSNIDSSNKKYLEKPVAITGIVTSVNNKEVILDNSIDCYFSEVNTVIKSGQLVTIKGRVIGYDDLLGELKLDQCNLSK